MLPAGAAADSSDPRLGTPGLAGRPRASSGLGEAPGCFTDLVRRNRKHAERPEDARHLGDEVKADTPTTLGAVSFHSDSKRDVDAS